VNDIVASFDGRSPTAIAVKIGLHQTEVFQLPVGVRSKTTDYRSACTDAA
jgi:hypothetical protein